ncbi:2TM domain-containing protein [Pseudoneobacillus sp. C159]
MIGWLIVACEIGFWLFVIAGLVTRYIFKQKKPGAILLWCTPIIDLLLIIATILDLRNGGEATILHGLAAYYIGMTIAFGKRMIHWADERFAYKFSDGPKPTKRVTFGVEHARMERKGWYRHLQGWAIGNGMLGIMILLVGDKSRTEALLNILFLWTVILVIDFLVSFSYTIFPKKESVKEGRM